MIEYIQHKKLDSQYVLNKIADFLDEDAPNGDKTTEGTIPHNKKVLLKFR